MWQAEVRIDLGAIRRNAAALCANTSAELMAVVKADGYGHGMIPAARAAVRGGASWLGVCTLDEALRLRAAGIRVPILAWLVAPGMPLHRAIAAEVDLSAGSVTQLDESVSAARVAGRPARLHLKVDTGLSRGGATLADWPLLCEAAAKANEDGLTDVIGVWSHFVYADVPNHPVIDQQLADFHRALDVAAGYGLTPRYRHIANSAALLTRPDSHFDLVRAGIAVYGLWPIPEPGLAAATADSGVELAAVLGQAAEPGSVARRFGLTPAMSVRARVALTKRVPAGQGVSYGHTYVTDRPATLALIPVGYADGVLRAAGNRAPIRLAGANRTVAGRISMDQLVLDCGDDPVSPGDVAILFGSGAGGEPTADDWAAALDTINYEIVARMGSARMPRVYDGEDG
jgi:alanine racemase